MRLTRRSVHTAIMFGMATAAIIGAVVGSFFTLVTSGAFTSDTLKTMPFVEITQEDVVEQAIEGMLEEERATIAVVEDVAPAVVSIVIEKERADVLAFDDYGYDFYAPFLAEDLYTEEELHEFVEIGGGTGFFVTQDGYIVTNKHVISDEGAVFTVLTNDGRTLDATVVATHPFEDLAVLDVEGEGYPTVTLEDSGNIFIGQTVIAIGYSLSEFQNTVTKGVVSGLNRSLLAGDYLNEVFIDNAIQTDAAINPGNSGGPLVNLHGEVVGVNTAISSEGYGIGFAIPVSSVERVIDDVLAYGYVRHPWLGVQYLQLDSLYSEEFGFEVTEGAYVFGDGTSGVFEGSPADLGGIQNGDVILRIDGVDVTQANTLSDIVATYQPEDIVTLTILREGAVFDLFIELGEYQAE
jgi:serine protease Do